MDKYRFHAYDGSYKDCFIQEKKMLARILNGARIEHAGSTAVEGLGGKGIIDIFIEVADRDAAKQQLMHTGYEYRDNAGTATRLFFRKDYHDPTMRRVHIHLFEKGDGEFLQVLRFRDTLRKNHEVRKEYEKLKKHAVTTHPDDGEFYKENKKDFIKRHSQA